MKTTVFLAAMFLFAPSGFAEEAYKSRLDAWAAHEKIVFEEFSAERDKKEGEARKALTRAENILKLTREHNDQEAETVAQQAVDIAAGALGMIRNHGRRSGARMTAVGKLREWGVDAGTAAVRMGVSSVVKGVLSKKTAKGWEPYDGTAPIRPGDELETGPDSHAELVFTDGATFSLDEKSGMKVALPEKTTSFFENIRGRARIIFTCAKLPREHQKACFWGIRTPWVVAAVRGTEIEMSGLPDGSRRIAVMSGSIDLIHRKTGGKIAVGPGQSIDISPKGKFGKPVDIEPDSLNRWWEWELP